MIATRHRLLLLVGGLTAAVLVLTAGDQIYDTNFYSLWEATALLAGDHPYRDFFEWGVPLQALVSLVGQVVAGHRLIGEFAIQWLGIIAGAVISFSLGLRASGSIAASLLMFACALALLATTATYHYPKLLFYPLAVWVTWRYLDAPDPRRAAAAGLVTAATFLFRHDHGVYIAAVAALAVVLARLASPRQRSVRAAALEGGAAAGTALVVLAPWLVLVQTSEGLPQYLESRLVRYAQGSPYSNPYGSLLAMNPFRVLTPEARPASSPGTVSFEWNGDLDEAQRTRLASEYGLHLVEGPDARGRWRYEAEDLLDPRLLGLRASVSNTEGFDWSRLAELRWPLPSRDDSIVWLQQLALVVPLLLLTASGAGVVRAARLHQHPPSEAAHLVCAAALLVIVGWRTFREPAYMTAVAPLTAAFGARLLVAGRGFRGFASAVRMVTLAFVLGVTAVATFTFSRQSEIFTPWRLAAGLPDVFEDLLASPPIDGLAPLDEVLSRNRANWNEQEAHAVEVLLRYIHQCTAPGDRVLVTGQTPFQVGYYLDRPIAGGHVLWHEGFRSDPVREQQSLELLQRQSVPFAYSTHDPVFDDFRRYPRIQAYLKTHYTELEGSRGLVLVDTRRRPTGEFGHLGFPCFR